MSLKLPVLSRIIQDQQRLHTESPGAPLAGLITVNAFRKLLDELEADLEEAETRAPPEATDAPSDTPPAYPPLDYASPDIHLSIAGIPFTIVMDNALPPDTDYELGINYTL